MAEAKGGRSLVLDAVTHRYPGGAIAVENINLDIKGGEIIALLGPSGCGKTTLLRIIAGFIAQTQGRIIIGDEIVDMLPPNKRAVGIVFQNYALFPHLTIAENVAYGLAARGVDTATRRREAQRLLELVQLPAMARAFAAPALRRPAAARGAGARAGDQAIDPAARRALRGARQESAARHADRDQAPPARFRHHHADRHARPGRSAVDGRPRRGSQPGPARAVRLADRRLRPAADRCS